MPDLQSAIEGLRDKPGYTLMRGLGRLGMRRSEKSGARSILHSAAKRRRIEDCRKRLSQTIFAGVDAERFVSELQRDGVAFGLKLPAADVAEILRWAGQNACYADRNPMHGFRLEQRAEAERALGKPILGAQYLTSTDCPAVSRLLKDPFLELIATRYLGSLPKLVGTNLWRTFPVKASEADRSRHAHLFHRDADDFRFFKLSFYITDVAPGDGAHVCVVGSQARPPMRKIGDRWNIRRYTDGEIAKDCPVNRIVEICAPAVPDSPRVPFASTRG